jgi:hypothetical protein
MTKQIESAEVGKNDRSSKSESTTEAKRNILIDLGPVEVETRGGAGGTPDAPFPGRDDPTITPGF